MVIDLTTLAADRVPVVADIPAAALDVPAEDFSVVGPARFEGDVERGSGETYHLRGQLKAQLALPVRAVHRAVGLCRRRAGGFAFRAGRRGEGRCAPVAVVEGRR